MYAFHIDSILFGRITGVARVGLRLLQNLSENVDLYLIRNLDTWNIPTRDDAKFEFAFLRKGSVENLFNDEEIKQYISGLEFEVQHLPILKRFNIIYPFWRPTLKLGKQEISYVHDLSGAYFPQYHSQETVMRMFRDLRDKSNLDDLTIVPSKRTLFDVLSLSDKDTESLIHIPHGPSFHPNLRPKAPEISIKDPFFIYVGSLDPRKGIRRLFNFWKRSAAFKEFKLLVCGDLAWWASNFEFQELIEDSVNLQIQFTGYLNDHEVKYLIERSLGLLNFSEFEGFGLPVLDCLISKLPAFIVPNSSFLDFENHGAVFVRPESDSLSIFDNYDTKIEFLRERHPFLLEHYNWNRVIDLILERVD